VRDLSAVEEIPQTGHGHQDGFELFLGVEARTVHSPGRARDEREATIVLDGRVRLDDEQRNELFALISAFFTKLALGGVDGLFALVDHSARNLERQRVAPEAILPHEHDFVGRRDRHDVAPVAAPYREGISTRAPRAVLQLDTTDFQDPEGADVFPRKLSPLSELRGIQDETTHGAPG